MQNYQRVKLELEHCFNTIQMEVGCQFVGVCGTSFWIRHLRVWASPTDSVKKRKISFFSPQGIKDPPDGVARALGMSYAWLFVHGESLLNFWYKAKCTTK